MRETFFVLLVLICWSCAFAGNESKEPQTSYDQLMAEGAEKMKAHIYVEAEKCFRDAVTLSKRLQARAVECLAGSLEMQGKKKDSLIEPVVVTKTDKAQFDADSKSYVANLVHHVNRFWSPPTDPHKVFQDSPEITATVAFKVDSKGELSEVKIRKSSGDRTIDFAAMQAVLDGKPYLPLPAGFPPMITVEVELRTGGAIPTGN